MSLLRRLGSHKIHSYVQHHGTARYSGMSDFIKNVRSAVDSSPELKKTVDELKKGSESLTEKAKLAAEEARKTASEAFEQTKQQAKTAAGFQPEEGPKASSSASADSGGDQARNGKAPEGDEKASFSGRTEDTQGARTTPKGAQSGMSARLWNAYSFVRKEVEAAVLPRHETKSATKARDPSIRPASGSGSTGITVVKQKDSRWQKQWADMQAKFGAHPIFQRLRNLSDNQVFNKGRDFAGDLRERWETSDSAVVQRLQDMKESMFTETEPAQALREIRNRYPAFDMVEFMRLLKGDVPLIIKAYLNGDLEALKEHCSKEMMERFSGIVAAQKAEGLTTDPTILDVSEVELVDLKFVENNPVVVVQFNCQQINCSRDKFGNVVEGGPQDVQRVYYYWALQQEDSGFVGQDGNFHPPRWQLREMMVRGMHNLL